VELTIGLIEILLLVAVLVGMAARRLKVPYTIGLVLAGIVLAFLPFTPNVSLTKELVFTIFLPPLIYEAAIYIRWKELRRDLLVIGVLATVGVVISAVVTAVGLHYLVNWSWQIAILFGVLIAATDPVSVIATFKEAGVEGRLRLLVEAESLFNDGTAAVAFVIALAFATGQPVTVGGVLGSLIITVGGGVLCGLVVAGAVLLLAGRTTDHLIETTLTTVAAYGSFLLAEHFHLSGVLACLTAGLLIGNVGHLGSFTDKGHEMVESFWEYLAFIANSLIFILIGIQEAHQDFSSFILPVGVAIVTVLLGRALAIYPLSALFAKSRLAIKPSHQHILFWGGLRGALALALVLGLPPELPERQMIITVAFGVVAFSLFVQGLTMTPLLKWLKEIPSIAQLVEEDEEEMEG
jgi:monovalent cation:H+ antiporter, CPA1 family